MWCNHGFKRTNPKGVQAIGQPTWLVMNNRFCNEITQEFFILLRW
jgi:hypothetical protein